MRTARYSLSLKNITALIIALQLLASCATPKQDKQPIIKNEVSVAEVKEPELTAQYYLQQASQATPSQSIPLLLKAAQLYNKNSKEEKALWLANQVKPLTHYPRYLYDIEIIRAQALVNLLEFSQASEALNQAEQLANQHTLGNNAQYYTLLSRLYEYKQLPLQKADAQLRAFALNSNASSQDVSQIWQTLMTLSQWELQQLNAMKPPHIKGWYQLLNATYQFSDDANRLSRTLIQWQRRFATHPGNEIVTLLKTETNIEQASVENIAVLLPLTGKQAAAGKAAQQGILAAYAQDSSKTLHFIDTNIAPINTLSPLLSNHQFNFIIGPLLKQNVDDYVAQYQEIPTLLLNIPTHSVLAMQHTALSMRREDEAIQAATTLSRQAFKHPVILSLTDNTSKRISQAFLERWQLINNQAPEIVYLDIGKSMQNTLKVALDVDQSQKRIKELEYRIPQNLETESRNRRDIDMIYVVGSPRETRLLKPYIDVNISTYANVIPVYASSLSHSASVDESEIRDLNGLTFTEMPWLLDSKRQQKQLAQRSQKIWPTRSDGLQRIFAMGYDSLALIDKIPVMKAHPYFRHFGQTGTLKLNDNNILTRSLLWGRYSARQVKEIAME